jgi:hypothetical protein
MRLKWLFPQVYVYSENALGGSQSMSTETESLNAAEETAEETKECNVLRVIGWLSVGMAVAALGVFVGREIYSRHKFNCRTPYDFYPHAGEQQTSDFGLGI